MIYASRPCDIAPQKGRYGGVPAGRIRILNFGRFLIPSFVPGFHASGFQIATAVRPRNDRTDRFLRKYETIILGLSSERKMGTWQRTAGQTTVRKEKPPEKPLGKGRREETAAREKKPPEKG